jgi:ethanolamine ammonia-lyase small subunit
MKERYVLKHADSTVRVAELKCLTDARVALGRVGSSMPIEEVLRFSHAHARARDAVHAAFDVEKLIIRLAGIGLITTEVRSAACDRNVYLRRPDLGRRLADDGCERLSKIDRAAPDVLMVIADGLSATAVQQNALPFLESLLPLLRSASLTTHEAVLVHNGRVAIGDEIGGLLKAKLVVLLIGERPGLSAADSLGVYITYAPRPGRSDAERNCISNIRDAGLRPPIAAQKALWLVTEALRKKLTGVALKDGASDLEELSFSRRD